MGYKPLTEAALREAMEAELRYPPTSYRPGRTDTELVAIAVTELARTLQQMAAVQNEGLAKMATSNRMVAQLIDRYITDTRVANMKADEWERRYRELQRSVELG